MTLKFYLACLLFLLVSSSHAQIAILERNISLEVRGEVIAEVLKKISQQGNFTFSYNPSAIEVSATVSFSATHQSVREVLTLIFQDKVTYKEKGKYLILQKNEESEKSKYFFLSGYIRDEQTGKKLAQASVYEPLTFASTVSNQYGYYQIRLPTTPLPLTINAAKQDYQAQKMRLDGKKTKNIDIMLVPETKDTIPIAIIRRQDSLAIREANPHLPDSVVIQMVENKMNEKESLSKRLTTPFARFFTSANQKINQLNIKDILSKKWQVGLVPYLSTNQLMGNTEVDFSLNLLVGSNAGVKKAELGGLVNIVRNNVGGFQAAGLFNLVGKQVNGVQFAGLGNIVGGEVKYAQAAGLFNINRGKTQGFQAAGLFNFNIKNGEGMSAAGLFNYQSGNYTGFQTSGLFSFTSQELKGVQVSALFNYARKIKKGVQIGLFNYVDSAETVIPIGLFSYIRKGGYHPIELSVNEMEFTNLTFKTGTRRFYTILTTGMQPHEVSKRLWQFGYGIGTYLRLGKTMGINLDLTAHHLSQDSFSRFLNLLNRASLSLEKKWQWFGIAVGPAWNLMITDIQSPYYQPIFDNFPQTQFYLNEQIESEFRIKSWVGAQVAVRFGR